MENSKKTLLALGLMLAIASLTHILAMEPQCNKEEIKELFEFIFNNTKVGIIGPNKSTEDFMKMGPRLQLEYIYGYIVRLSHQLMLIQERNPGRVPGTINPRFQIFYDRNVLFLSYYQKLFDVIKDSCGITDNEAGEIIRKVKAKQGKPCGPILG